jgi:multiple sugar transport system permease protein
MSATSKRQNGAQSGRGVRRSRSGGKERRLLRPSTLPYVLILPALLFELLIHIVPMIFGVVISLFQLNQFYIRNWINAPFVGLDNFKIGLNTQGPIGSELVHSFLITCAYTLLVVTCSWLFGVTAALLVNAEFRGRGWFRTLFLIPYALPIYVAILAWQFMLQQKNGAVNTLLVQNLHVLDHSPFWLLGGNAFWSMVVTSLWRTWPFAFLILLAALQNIPAELYDAASVDGASKLRQFRSITLPLIRPVSVVVILVMFLWNFNDFNTPYVLFGQAPPPAADLLSLHIYINSFVDLNFGLGAAMSTLLLLFLLVVSIVYIRLLHVGGESNA